MMRYKQSARAYSDESKTIRNHSLIIKYALTALKMKTEEWRPNNNPWRYTFLKKKTGNQSSLEYFLGTPEYFRNLVKSN